MKFLDYNFTLISLFHKFIFKVGMLVVPCDFLVTFLNVRYQHVGNILCWSVATGEILGYREHKTEGEGWRREVPYRF